MKQLTSKFAAVRWMVKQKIAFEPGERKESLGTYLFGAKCKLHFVYKKKHFPKCVSKKKNVKPGKFCYL